MESEKKEKMRLWKKVCTRKWRNSRTRRRRRRIYQWEIEGTSWQRSGM